MVEKVLRMKSSPACLDGNSGGVKYADEDIIVVPFEIFISAYNFTSALQPHAETAIKYVSVSC